MKDLVGRDFSPCLVIDCYLVLLNTVAITHHPVTRVHWFPSRISTFTRVTGHSSIFHHCYSYSLPCADCFPEPTLLLRCGRDLNVDGLVTLPLALPLPPKLSSTSNTTTCSLTATKARLKLPAFDEEKMFLCLEVIVWDGKCCKVAIREKNSCK